MCTCEMVRGYKSSKPDPQDFEDFDVEMPCGKAATWYYASDDSPTICDECFVEMIKGDLELAFDYTRTSIPAQVVETIKGMVAQYENPDWKGPKVFLTISIIEVEDATRLGFTRSDG